MKNLEESLMNKLNKSQTVLMQTIKKKRTSYLRGWISHLNSNNTQLLSIKYESRKLIFFYLIQKYFIYKIPYKILRLLTWD